MTRRRIHELTQRIGQALWRAHLTTVTVEVDRAGICYLSGRVHGADEEARAVEIAWSEGARDVENALTWPGRPETPQRVRRSPIARSLRARWLPSRAARAARIAGEDGAHPDSAQDPTRDDPDEWNGSPWSPWPRSP